MVLFGAAALSAGALAALASVDFLMVVVILLVVILAAWVLPLPWATILLAALVPFQFYIPLPGSSFTIRVALVFAYALAARLLLDQLPSLVDSRRSADVHQLGWLLPFILFLLCALIAAFWAQDRYVAFKGIYEWLAVFVAAIVIAVQRPSRLTVRLLLIVLIAGGVLQALLGLVQYALSLDGVIGLLRFPASRLLYQPDLLDERLTDLSFNWLTPDRVLPFGTFINAIDYAVFLAAIVSLAVALIITPKQQSVVGGRCTYLALVLSAAVIAIALLLTLKGSGALALAGGIAAIALFYLPRLSRRIVVFGVFMLLFGVALAVPSSELVGQRVLFLIQREQGIFGTTGRLAIWSSLLQFTAQQPFFGYGLNNAIAFVEPQRTLRDGASGFLVATPESAYVSLLVETGIVGVIAVLAWLLSALTIGFRRAVAGVTPLYLGMVAALAALLAGNLTVSGFTTDQNGMLLGMLVGMIHGMGRDE